MMSSPKEDGICSKISPLHDPDIVYTCYAYPHIFKHMKNWTVPQSLSQKETLALGFGTLAKRKEISVKLCYRKHALKKRKK